MSSVIRIAVIGGGVSGATSAYVLARKLEALGLRAEIKIFESAERLGGKIHTTELAGAPIELGAEGVSLRDPRVSALIEELDLSPITPAKLPFGIKHTKRAGSGGGEITAINPAVLRGYPNNIWPILTQAGVSLLGRIVAACKQLGVTPGRESSTVQGQFGKEFATKIIEPIISGIYGSSSNSLDAKLVADLTGTGANRGRSLSLGGGGAALCGIKGGLGELIRRLTRHSFIAVATDTPAQSLQVGGALDSSIYINSEQFDYCMLALPLAGAVKLLDPLISSELISATNLAADLYSARAVLTLGLPEQQLKTPRISGYIIPQAQTIRGVSFYSEKWPHLAVQGKHIVRVFFGGSCISSSSEGELLELAMYELAWYFGTQLKFESYTISKWQDGALNATPELQSQIALFSSSVNQLPKVALVSTALLGQGIARCMGGAIETSESLCNKILTNLNNKQGAQYAVGNSA